MVITHENSGNRWCRIYWLCSDPTCDRAGARCNQCRFSDLCSLFGKCGKCGHHPNYVFEHVDIRDRAALDAVFSNIPLISDAFGSRSHVDRSIDGPAGFMETNVNGTFNMLEAAQLLGGARETGRFQVPSH